MSGADQQFHLVIHVDDIAYDLHSEGGARGGYFLRIIDPAPRMLPTWWWLATMRTMAPTSPITPAASACPTMRSATSRFTAHVGPLDLLAISTESCGCPNLGALANAHLQLLLPVRHDEHLHAAALAGGRSGEGEQQQGASDLDPLFPAPSFLLFKREFRLLPVLREQAGDSSQPPLMLPQVRTAYSVCLGWSRCSWSMC